MRLPVVSGGGCCILHRGLMVAVIHMGGVIVHTLMLLRVVVVHDGGVGRRIGFGKARQCGLEIALGVDQEVG